jgi:hypothetical protein
VEIEFWLRSYCNWLDYLPCNLAPLAYKRRSRGTSRGHKLEVRKNEQHKLPRAIQEHRIYGYYPPRGIHLLCYYRSLDLMITHILNHYHKPRQLTLTIGHVWKSNSSRSMASTSKRFTICEQDRRSVCLLALICTSGGFRINLRPPTLA